jgi:hypothetical protein
MQGLLSLCGKLPECIDKDIGVDERKRREGCLFFRQQQVYGLRHVRGNMPGLRYNGI